MGWLYCADTRQELIAKLRTDGPVIASKVRGSHLWQVYEYPDGRREIVLFLLGIYDGQHGYKAMGETTGPFYYDCPLSLLDLAEPAPTTEWAIEWRRKVRSHHANQTKKVVGATVVYGDRKYILRQNLGRQGWEAYCPENGCTYRMKATQAKRAELVTIDAEVAA